MKCQYCGCMDSRVVDSRPSDGGATIRRRRECIRCGRRYTTYEKAETSKLMVVKHDGRREAFDPEKIRTGIVRSTGKLPISTDQIDEIVDRIEANAHNNNAKEISSQELGEMVMNALKEISEVAYVRYASVYRKFTDLGTFMEELEKLAHENAQTKEN
ncbi:MAG: transcriptional repressor NrdR [Clostridia bacterium]|nr:transcriptional repressor NrdR [Clostridia bacterium]